MVKLHPHKVITSKPTVYFSTARMDNLSYISWHWDQVRLNLTRYLFSLTVPTPGSWTRNLSFLELWDWKPAGVWVSPPNIPLLTAFSSGSSSSSLFSSSKYLSCLLFRLGLQCRFHFVSVLLLLLVALVCSLTQVIFLTHWRLVPASLFFPTSLSVFH